MILRVLDHYQDFHCIADKCKDSCCIGWEIDIDEDTYDYYRTVGGKLGKRLKNNIYENEDGDHCFRLSEDGRCPFLSTSGLCDICSELGEEAFSEVCTEYPRFSVYYGNVLQKTLALSCEEVGRIVFSNQGTMSIVDIKVPETEGWEAGDETDDSESRYHGDLVDCDHTDTDKDVTEAYDYEDYGEDPRVIEILETAQKEMIDILQNRTTGWEERLKQLFKQGNRIQNKINDPEGISDEADIKNELWEISLQKAIGSFNIWDRMEILDGEWEEYKVRLSALYSSDENYKKTLALYMGSSDYREKDYEHLMVYFVFRYCMTAVLDENLISKLRMALQFTLLLRDMAAVRFTENGGSFTTIDQIDIARIFSKEVEHSEENVAWIEEELLFS